MTLLRHDETDRASDAFITCECGPRDYHSSVLVERLQDRLEEARGFIKRMLPFVGRIDEYDDQLYRDAQASLPPESK